jgi:hypothetical protein
MSAAARMPDDIDKAETHKIDGLVRFPARLLLKKTALP